MRKRSEVVSDALAEPSAKKDDREYNGLLCSVCGQKQYVCSSGVVCAGGHGEVEGVKKWSPEMIKGIAIPKMPEIPNPTETRVSEVTDEEGLSVNVTWGEEMVTLSQGNAYRVGPFSSQTIIRRGETRKSAMERVYSDLVVFANEAHAAKAARFNKRGNN